MFPLRKGGSSNREFTFAQLHYSFQDNVFGAVGLSSAKPNAYFAGFRTSTQSTLETKIIFLNTIVLHRHLHQMTIGHPMHRFVRYPEFHLSYLQEAKKLFAR